MKILIINKKITHIQINLKINQNIKNMKIKKLKKNNNK